MVCHALRSALAILCRNVRKLGLEDNAKAIEQRLTRDDLPRWFVDADGFGPETWSEIRGGIDTAFAIAAQYNIPQLQQRASNALRAYEEANLLIEDALQMHRAMVPPAANRNASSHLSLVVPVVTTTIAASADFKDVVSVSAVTPAPTGTVPCPPSTRGAA